MPHDRDGRVINPGDTVLVPCRVLVVHNGEEYCNVDLETSQPMYPGDSRTKIVLNARQVVLASTPRTLDEAAAPGSQEEREAKLKAFPILAFFRYEQLPPKLQEISKPFGLLAWEMAMRPTNNPAELSAGLRKLLEAKDCIVRAGL